MSLQQEVPLLLEYINDSEKTLEFNKVLFDVYEGELLPHIESALKAQLSFQAYEQARHRIAPINVLQRLVDKLSTIYQGSVMRLVQDGSDSDQELVTWYEDQFNINKNMNVANEFFNLFSANLIQPFLHLGQPRIRVVPNDRFLVWSTDRVDPTNPTHVIILMETRQEETKDGVEHVNIYHAYTDEEFIIFNSKKQIMFNEMAQLGNEGLNPFGKIPFIYVNRSSNLLMPKEERDAYQLARLVPVILSDLSVAIMFQAFSILYITDGDPEGLTMSPNAIWNIKSDPTSDKQTQIDSIKPQVDIQEVLGFIKAQMTMWLETKGVKAGAMGKLDGDEASSSGIAKIMDNMDTAEHRQKQVTFFMDAEKRFWDLVLKHMHPVWSKAGLIENREVFSPNAWVQANFPEQLPLIRRGDVIRDLIEELKAGFISRERAIKKLNPHFTDEEIQELMNEVDAERTIEMPQEPEGDENEE